MPLMSLQIWKRILAISTACGMSLLLLLLYDDNLMSWVNRFNSRTINCELKSKPNDSNSSCAFSRQKCQRPISEIVFIKVHKAGSTTVTSMLMRYAYIRNLTAAVPRSGLVNLGWPSPFTPRHVQAPPRPPYHILALHSVYNREQMLKVMPPTAKFVTILREPFHNFISWFHYYTVATKMSATSERTATGFLRNPTLHKNVFTDVNVPYGRNMMSLDLGMKKNIADDTDAIRSFIGRLEEQFFLVMIFEYFEESLVLLKRYMCWELKDIIFIKTMPAYYNGKYEPGKGESLKMAQTLYKKWSTADYMLYDHFYKSFWKRVEKEGTSFKNEVIEFKSINKRVEQFCKHDKLVGNVYINRSQWNRAFNVSNCMCEHLQRNDLDFSAAFKKRYATLFQG